MQPAALLVDAMGTLVRLDDPVRRLTDALHDELGLVVGRHRARGALAAEIAHYRAHMDEARDDERLRALRMACACVLRDALGHDPALSAADPEVFVAVLERTLRFDAYPDARGALARARRAGARVVVVSNWDVSLADVLERIGLAPLLDGVLTSAAVGARKPATEIFTAAVALAGCEAPRCLHVGDSLTDDVAGARALGIPAVWLRRQDAGDDPPSGVPTIATLDELDLGTAGVWT